MDERYFKKAIEVKTQKPVSYTIPQKIHLPIKEKLIDISFRTDKVLGKSVIKVANSDGDIICKYSREYIIPGELEKINVPTMLIKNEQNSITIFVEEG